MPNTNRSRMALSQEQYSHLLERVKRALLPGHVLLSMHDALCACIAAAESYCQDEADARASARLMRQCARHQLDRWSPQ